MHSRGGASRCWRSSFAVPHARRPERSATTTTAPKTCRPGRAWGTAGHGSAGPLWPARGHYRAGAPQSGYQRRKRETSMSDPSTPGSGPAGWQPDPTGRHQYRYWSGSAWTDNVSDSGATSVDPYSPSGPPSAVPPTQSMPTSPPTAGMPLTPVATPGPAGPTFTPPGGPPVGGPPPAAAAGGTGGGSSKAPFIIGAVVVVALLVAGFLLFKGNDSGGGGTGAGTFTLDVPKDGTASH